MSTNHRESWETNRIIKRKPKRGLFYCDSCDKDSVEAGKKCRYCGVRDSEPKRDKNYRYTI